MIDNYSLSLEGRIELWELDLNPIGVEGVLRICNERDVTSAPIVWRGNEYQKVPVSPSGFQIRSGGSPATPRIVAGNPNGALSQLIIQNKQLINAEVRRYVITENNLDGVPGANPNETIIDQVWFVSRPGDGPVNATLTLRHPLESMNLRIPRRRMGEFID